MSELTAEQAIEHIEDMLEHGQGPYEFMSLCLAITALREREELKRKADAGRDALSNIKRHVKLFSPSAYEFSGVWNIADIAIRSMDSEI